MREQALRARLGRTLREARDALGLTQRAVATKAGIGDKYLSRIERGLTTPSLLVAQRLSVALGVGLDQLVALPRPERDELEGAIARLLDGRTPSELERAERVLLALFR